MKFILVIPVLLLFIGQVPFMKHMEKMMTERMANEAKKESCCKKKKSADKGCAHKTEGSETKEDSCCQKPEARCASCVCCFSVAPVTEASALNKFNSDALKKERINTEDKLLSQYYPVLTPPPDLGLFF